MHDMAQDLIINERNMGRCTAYRQDREWPIPCWKFAMSEGFEIVIPFYMIKLFRSGEGLKLTLHNIESGEKADKEA